ncbi:MAG: DUF1287 domain-containing protein [Hyphomicrobiaceae bacterium]|nr:DUF1287 domain-containing protein [Hyphomicrobiaceae bacterium]
MRANKCFGLAAAAVSACAFLIPPLHHAAARPQDPVNDAQRTYGQRLVAAARQQLSVFVVYSPAYVKLDYPGGDIPAYRGVCTDVVVRAYRALGHDLQKEIHESGVGTGDRNIDHRRVEVQRQYFAKHGRSLALLADPKADPARFLPGDIVTYHLPDGWYSKTHVGIVSDRRSAAGVPLIIHNRGIGVQEEDWLFGSRLTGHYRFSPAR